MNKKLQEIKRLLQNAEDSDNIKEMEMQIVKLELQLKNAETEIERLRTDTRILLEKTATQPTRIEFWGGVLTVVSLIVAILALG